MQLERAPGFKLISLQAIGLRLYRSGRFYCRYKLFLAHQILMILLQMMSHKGGRKMSQLPFRQQESGRNSMRQHDSEVLSSDGKSAYSGNITRYDHEENRMCQATGEEEWRIKGTIENGGLELGMQ
jgi:hypothetical protein